MRTTLIILLAALCTSIRAQHEAFTLSGSLQSDLMIAPQQDRAIGTDHYDNRTLLTNTYLDLQAQSRAIDAGVRLEFMQWPMPGFDNAYNHFKGWGVPHAWVKLRSALGGATQHSNAELTLGTYYEQFGSGLILRTYEERTLGIDNSLLGARLKLSPCRGLALTALSGLQRTYWRWERNLISGADAELSLDQLMPTLSDRDTRLTLGASWVNKHERTAHDIVMADPTHRLRLPHYTNAFDFRARLNRGGIDLLAEQAFKTADPNSLNNYAYHRGTASMLSASYAKRGLSILAQAKRSENMASRSQRSLHPLSSAGYINHMPAFTLDHTYALAALYPYATQSQGEWAFQGGIGYRFGHKAKRTTASAKGRTARTSATKLNINYSLVRGLEHNNAIAPRGSDGPSNAYFKMGHTYYQDLNVQLEKRLSRALELHLMYMYQQYNKGIIQGKGGNIYSHIAVGEGKLKLGRRTTLRAEAQYLATQHESGNWGFGLLELSLAPRLMLSVQDQIGHAEPSAGEYGSLTHYYSGTITLTLKSHRLALGYGRTRAGYNCTGGVCRYIPAYKGLTLNYNYNF